MRKLEFENDAFGFADKVIEKCAFFLPLLLPVGPVARADCAPCCGGTAAMTPMAEGILHACTAMLRTPCRGWLLHAGQRPVCITKSRRTVAAPANVTATAATATAAATPFSSSVDLPMQVVQKEGNIKGVWT